MYMSICLVSNVNISMLHHIFVVIEARKKYHKIQSEDEESILKHISRTFQVGPIVIKKNSPTSHLLNSNFNIIETYSKFLVIT